MDDEKKMTLGVEEEKQFHSRFPFSRFSHPIVPSCLRLRSLCLSLSLSLSLSPSLSLSLSLSLSRSLSLSLSLSLFSFFRSTHVAQRSPPSRDDCNLHKLSFHFDDDVASRLSRREKREVVNDRNDRILCASSILRDRRAIVAIENLPQVERSHSAVFYLHHRLDYLDMCQEPK